MTDDSLDKALPAGKLPALLLTTLLGRLPATGPGVVVGARYGEDAAVIEVGARYLVLALDPVTLSTEPGRIAVEINANDVAVMGAEPRWLLAAILLPTGSTGASARAVLDGLQQGCAQIGATLVGGHTEISPSVTQPVVAACMIGEVAPERLVLSSGARPGDAILLAGAIAVEGTGILAGEHAEALRSHGVSEDTILAGAALLERPGISVLPAVQALERVTLPHAMHDPTEGGLVSALHELATASHVGLRIDAERIPILPPCRTICGALDVDPLALLASGSLIAMVAPDDVTSALGALKDAGIDSAAIGTVMPEADGRIMVRDDAEEPLHEVERDELARWIEGTGR